MKTIVASSTGENAEDDSEADDSGNDPDVPPLKLGPANLRKVLEPPESGTLDDTDQEEVPASMAGKLKRSVKKLHFQK